MHHNGGHFNLRWRGDAGDGGVPVFFELTTTARGRLALATLPTSVRRCLELNLTSSTCRHELRRLRDYLFNLDVLRDGEQENAR